MLTFSQICQNFLRTATWVSAPIHPLAAALAGLAAALVVSACSRATEPDQAIADPAPSASVMTGAAGTAGATGAASAASPGPWAPANGVRFSLAPEAGDVKSIVSGELAQARTDGRRILVYVGATWCEPCQRFHHAAAEGKLDDDLGKLTLVQFDLDRDRDRLKAAGYTSDFIPLFALPAPDGTASSHHMEGSIKGDGAVAQIVPRLQSLLAQN